MDKKTDFRVVFSIQTWGNLFEDCEHSCGSSIRDTDETFAKSSSMFTEYHFGDLWQVRSAEAAVIFNR